MSATSRHTPPATYPAEYVERLLEDIDTLRDALDGEKELNRRANQRIQRLVAEGRKPTHDERIMLAVDALCKIADRNPGHAGYAHTAHVALRRINGGESRRTKWIYYG